MVAVQPVAYRDERLAVIVTFVVMGMALSALLPLPSREFVLDLFGSELSLRFSGPVQVLVLVAGLVCAGVDTLVHRPSPRLAPALARPGAYVQDTGPGSLLYRAAFWSLPTTLAVIGLVVVHSVTWWGYQVGAALLSGIVLALVIAAQLATHTLDTSRRRALRLLLNGLVYVLALVLFGIVFGARLRSLLSATGVLLGSALLAIELFRNSETHAWRIWLSAGLVALVMGEITWALNYTQLSNPAASALLLLLFYAITGMVQQNLWHRLTSRVVTEYVTILAGGTLLVLLFL